MWNIIKGWFFLLFNVNVIATPATQHPPLFSHPFTTKHHTHSIIMQPEEQPTRPLPNGNYIRTSFAHTAISYIRQKVMLAPWKNNSHLKCIEKMDLFYYLLSKDWYPVDSVSVSVLIHDLLQERATWDFGTLASVGRGWILAKLICFITELGVLYYHVPRGWARWCVKIAYICPCFLLRHPVVVVLVLVVLDHLIDTL